MVQIEGVTMTAAAAESVRETGTSVLDDVTALRLGRVTRVQLLADCLDGADEDRVQGWRDYVEAAVDAASDTSHDCAHCGLPLLNGADRHNPTLHHACVVEAS